MRRAAWIAAAVLAPFAGLVALGFSLEDEQPRSSLPPPELRLEPAPPAPAPAPSPPAPAARPSPPPLPLAIPVVAPPQEGPEVKPPPQELSDEARRIPMLAAVEPLVQQCFKDVAERVREPLQVAVAFDTTAAGGFESIVIKKASWQDPHLAACIIDAFEDARFEPSGLVVRRQVRTFTFPRADGGR